VDWFGDNRVAGFEPELGFRLAGRELSPRREAFLLRGGSRSLFEPGRNLRHVTERLGGLLGALANRLKDGRPEELLPNFPE